MKPSEIIALLPYEKPFLFVDKLFSVNDEFSEGSYTFSTDEFFYKGHFKDHPVTPGVILTEVMAQIGVVCLGIYLIAQENTNLDNVQVALASHEIDFYKPVFPGETVKVVSEKEYFRFHKLKCKVAMYNDNNELVCRGFISGMLKNLSDGA
ncbi:MAG: hydroxymyristoyl-ACP dehydratase [Flavobacteriaceae bacterium]|nr:hydroxymyristoyl-ACP dehydratase [Flavobacteriaceae bacterium]|tara:strand:+ start:369457 stop:369909 length:453 start_codon:yes stop_codon:yes gene_type:complete